MGVVQVIASIIGLGITAVAIVLVTRTVRRMISVIRLGQPDPTRTANPAGRTRTMLTETLGHTRMLKWTVVGTAHWFVFVAFGALLFTLIEAFGELFDPAFKLPIIGSWVVYGLIMELIAAFAGVGILVLIGIRLRNLPGRKKNSRFVGSTMWQAYYVEATVLAIIVCVFLIRGFKVAAGDFPFPTWATPISHGVGNIFDGMSESSAKNAITLTAMVKVVVSFAWFIVIALNITMGVAWHRFLAFFNIFFKRIRHEEGRARRAAADDEQRGAARLRAGRPGEGPVRRRARRAVQLEGHPRLLHLHRVRALPVAVPGLEHRQAAVAEAADPVAARSRVREGALPSGRRRHDARPARRRRPRPSSRT